MKRTSLAAVTACFVCLFAQGITAIQGAEASQKHGLNQNNPIPHFADYFPIHAGATFSYTIEMGYVEPVAYEEIKWPGATATKRIFNNAEYAPRKTFLLELKIKDPAKNLEQSKIHPGWFEVSVEKDELGVYKNAKQIFWSVDPSHQTFREVAIYQPDDSMTPKGFSEDGTSERVLLFHGKAGTKIDRTKYFKSPHDTLTFNGIEKFPGQEAPVLHFVRHVNAGLPDGTPNPNSMDEFEEHSYFARYKGLVYREQRIGGNTSMTWKVTDNRK